VFYSSEYTSDFIRWLGIIEDRAMPPSELEKLQDKIIKTNDAGLAYFCALEFPYRTDRMQKIIIGQKNASYALLFAQHIKNADIKSLQHIVIESKIVKLITKFACFVNGANQRKLEKLVIKSGIDQFAHMIVKHCKNANIDQLKPIILKTGKPRYLFELSKHVSSKKDIVLIEGLIIKSGNANYIRIFADKIKGANIDRLEEAIIALGNQEDIKRFAQKIKTSKLKKFLLIG
jgi:hypothetical protein